MNKRSPEVAGDVADRKLSLLREVLNDKKTRAEGGELRITPLDIPALRGAAQVAAENLRTLARMSTGKKG